MRWTLVKGLARQTGHWHDFPARLSATGAEVLCLDLPGAGKAADRPVPLSVPRVTDDIRSRWLAEPRAAGGECLVGISLGGMVAIDWTTRFPQDFSGQVIVNASARRNDWIFQRLRPAAWSAFARMILAGDQRRREWINLELNTHRGPGALGEYLDQRVELARQSPISLSVAVRQLIAAARFRGPDRFAVPTLVVVGQRDRLADPACSHRLASFPNASLRCHRDAGHELSLDDPDWLLAQLVEWQTELTRRTTPCDEGIQRA